MCFKNLCLPLKCLLECIVCYRDCRLTVHCFSFFFPTTFDQASNRSRIIVKSGLFLFHCIIFQLSFLIVIIYFLKRDLGYYVLYIHDRRSKTLWNAIAQARFSGTAVSPSAIVPPKTIKT